MPSLPPVLLVETGSSLAGATGPDLTRYFLVCAGLLLLVGVLAFAARRFLGRHLKRRATERSLQVVDVLPLGGKQKLCVVRCYDRTFLLGLGNSEVRSIAELDAEGPRAGGADRSEPASASTGAATVELQPSRSFGERLVSELDKLPRPSPQGAARPEAAPWNPGEGVLG